MSKGLGKWQRMILLGLKFRDFFTIRELLGLTFTRAEYNALNRAMLELERAGKIKVCRFGLGSGGRDWVCRFGVTPTGADRSLNVGKVFRGELHQHLKEIAT
ncbi:MAG: hypothetical protein KBG09_05055 [Syntrophobacterales bacterium]|jgi:hypothetical protein|nr:hypothetical protein [Syntrophobacterales bacterium]